MAKRSRDTVFRVITNEAFAPLASARDYWLKGRSCEWADVRSDLPPMYGLRKVEGGIGRSLTGESLLTDPWIVRAIAALCSRRV